MKLKGIILLLLLFCLCHYLLAQTGNYVNIHTYVTPDRYPTKTVYYDDMGREIAESREGALPSSGKDIVTLTEYDKFGRKSSEWLPTAVSGFDGIGSISTIRNTTHRLYSISCRKMRGIRL